MGIFLVLLAPAGIIIYTLLAKNASYKNTTLLHRHFDPALRLYWSKCILRRERNLLGNSAKARQISPSRKRHLTIEILQAQSKWRARGWWFCNFRDNSGLQIIHSPVETPRVYPMFCRHAPAGIIIYTPCRKHQLQKQNTLAPSFRSRPQAVLI